MANKTTANNKSIAILTVSARRFVVWADTWSSTVCFRSCVIWASALAWNQCPLSKRTEFQLLCELNHEMSSGTWRTKCVFTWAHVPCHP
jgi:hypothetical protein